jgi:hypothetical protein
MLIELKVTLPQCILYMDQSYAPSGHYKVRALMCLAIGICRARQDIPRLRRGGLRISGRTSAPIIPYSSAVLLYVLFLNTLARSQGGPIFFSCRQQS